MNSIPSFSIKLNSVNCPYSYLLIKKKNTEYIELLTEKYGLSNDELLFKALNLAELNLAELEARATAATARGCYEA